MTRFGRYGHQHTCQEDVFVWHVCKDKIAKRPVNIEKAKKSQAYSPSTNNLARMGENTYIYVCITLLIYPYVPTYMCLGTYDAQKSGARALINRVEIYH